MEILTFSNIGHRIFFVLSLQVAKLTKNSREILSIFLNWAQDLTDRRDIYDESLEI